MLRRGFWVESFSIYRCVFGGLNKGFCYRCYFSQNKNCSVKSYPLLRGGLRPLFFKSNKFEDFSELPSNP